MGFTRRDFLKISGMGAAGLALSHLGFDFSPVETFAQEFKLKGAKETTTVCCYCSVGCGMIVHTDSRVRSSTWKAIPNTPSAKAPFVPRGRHPTKSLSMKIASRRSATGPLSAINGRRSPGSGHWRRWLLTSKRAGRELSA